MTVLTRWEPFREFATLQDRMNRLFRESYNDAGRDESLTTSNFAPAVDVYALACVLYEALTGATPYSGDDLPNLLAAHVTLPPPRPTDTKPGRWPTASTFMPCRGGRSTTRADARPP